MQVVSRRFSFLLVVVLAACAIFLGVAPAGAQSATGSVEGTIVDQSGALLPGVTVTLVEADTGAQRVTLSDADGRFAALLLPVGVYNLTAELAGFVSQKQSEIKVTIGQTITLRLQMSVSGVAESVTVSGVTPIIETGRSQVSSTVDETAVQNLPVNGRNFIDFALLTPGVTRDVAHRRHQLRRPARHAQQPGRSTAPTTTTRSSARRTGRTGSGRAPYQFSQDAVKEFQVNSNSFSAEYGRAGGAVINVVTKSGTNELHGSAFEFYRDKALNANNAINELNGRPKSPYHYNQFGGTLGGPIRRNRDFYLRQLRRPAQHPAEHRVPQPAGDHADRPGDAGRHRAAAAAGRELGPHARSGRLPGQDRPRAERRQPPDAALQPSELHRRRLRERRRAERARAHRRLAGEDAHASTPRWTERAQRDAVQRGARSSTRATRSPARRTATNPEAVVQQSGTTVLTIGRNNFSPRETTIKRWQVADTLTWVRGAHKLKGGFDFQFDDILNYFPGFFSGVVHVPQPRVVRRRTAERRQRVLPAELRRGRTRPARRPIRTSTSTRSSCRTSGGRRATSRVNLGLRYDLMKTDAAAGAQSRSAARRRRHRYQPPRRRHQQLRAAPRRRLEPARPARSWCAAAGGCSTAARPSIMLGTAHSNNGINIVVADVHRRRGADLSAEVRHAFRPAAPPSRPTIFYIDKDFANAQPDAGQRRGRVADPGRRRR